MTKKIFAISTLLLVLVVAFAFVYNFIFKKPSADKSSPDKAASSKSTSVSEGKVTDNSNAGDDASRATANTAAPAADSPITAASDEIVFGATLSADGQFIYYFLSGNGQLNQVLLDGKLDKVLSTEKYTNINGIIWNKQKNRAIIKTAPAPGKTKYLVYNLMDKKVSILKENTDAVVWSNLGDRIIYKYYDPKTKKRTISLADPDGKNWKDLTEVGHRYVDIAAVPNSADISFWPSPDAALGTSVNIVPFDGGDERVILEGRFGADLLWSPDGSAAVSYTEEKDGHKTDLATMDSSGNRFQSLGFPTFASKCTWSADSKYLYCALPGDIPGSAVLPNDWRSGKIRTTDTFWKIEVSSGKKTRLVETESISGSYDAISPFLSKDEKSLFFINKEDGKLYNLKM